MTAKEVIAELDREPFQPLRLHMVSGKVFDILTVNIAHPLRDSLLVLRHGILGNRVAEGYDVLAYDNIERIEQLHMGKQPKKRRSA